MAVIGLDLGGTKIAGAVFDADGRVIAEHDALLGRRAGAEVGALLRRCAQPADGPGAGHRCRRHLGARHQPREDAVASGRRTSRDGRTIRCATKSGPRCRTSRCRSWWRPTGRAASWARRGAARRAAAATPVFLTVGTGIGAGIMADGRILHGAHDIAGAVGWLALDRPWDERYRACGCFEHYASGDGIARYARELLAARRDASRAAGTGGCRDADGARRLCGVRRRRRGRRGGAATCRRVVGHGDGEPGEPAEPERIIFGGGVFGPAVRFLDDIAREARHWAQPISIEQVVLAPSALGGRAAVHGAGHSPCARPAPATPHDLSQAARLCRGVHRHAAVRHFPARGGLTAPARSPRASRSTALPAARSCRCCRSVARRVADLRPIVDRFGYKGPLLASAVVVIAGLEALAFAPSVAVLRTAIVAVGFGAAS